MNLENLNLVELNVQEVQEVDGGFLAMILAGAIVYLAYETFGNPSASSKAYMSGYNAGYNYNK